MSAASAQIQRRGARLPNRGFISVLAIVLIALAACRDSASPSAARVRILDASAEQNPYNRLSFRVHLNATGADSARVVYWSADQRDTTPFFPLATGTVTDLPLVGLLAGTAYRMQIDARSGSLQATSDTLSGTTGDLPAPLQTLHLAVSGSIPQGFLLTDLLGFDADSVGYSLAFDQLGRIRWYREFREGIANMPVIETKQQPNGNFTAYVGAPGRLPLLTRYYEFTPLGDVVREYTAPSPFYLDNHELLLTFEKDGTPTAHYFAYDMRQVDTFPPALKGDTMIAGNRLIRQRLGGEPEIVWNSWDHFSIADVVEPGASYAIDHPNSIAFDLDSNYIVSWRNVGEITKIHARTGAIMWRLGGPHNEFTFVNDPLNGFSGQHSPRILANGNLLLYDNGWTHSPSLTRAAEYKLDVAKRTATLVWEYRHSPTIFTQYVGSVQRQKNGNTLIGYGLAARIAEVTPASTVVFEAVVMSGDTPITFYRALRVPSLYRYLVP